MILEYFLITVKEVIKEKIVSVVIDIVIATT